MVGPVLDDVEGVEDNLPTAQALPVAAADGKVLALDVDGHDWPVMVDDGRDDACLLYTSSGH